MLQTLRAYVELTKPRILELLLVTTIPVMVFAADGLPDLGLMAAVLIGGALSAGSAGVFNMYIERESDALMERTAQRPLVTGIVSPRAGLTFAWALAAGSVVWMLTLVGPLPAALSTAGLVLYVAFYTVLLKRRTEQNVVWGGVAGCVPVLVGWSAVRGGIEWPAVVLFLVVFFWTPAHYWPLSIRYRDDYRRAGVPMLGATRPPGLCRRQGDRVRRGDGRVLAGTPVRRRGQWTVRGDGTRRGRGFPHLCVPHARARPARCGAAPHARLPRVDRLSRGAVPGGGHRSALDAMTR